MTGTSVQFAAGLLAAGDVVAIPTETVYGLAGNIFNEQALKKIYAVKQRPLHNPLIVHVADMAQAEAMVAKLPANAAKLAAAFWPGPLTLILPKHKQVPDLVTANQDHVAIRIPAHPLTLELLATVNFPLAAPSANPFNYISPVTAQAVEEMLGDKIPYILDGGPCQRGIESTIVAFEGEQVKILRPGVITEQQVAEVTDALLQQKNKETTIAHPGMFSKHYSPRTPLLLTDTITEAVQQNAGLRIAVISFKDPYAALQAAYKIQLSPSGSLEEAARNLYYTLYRLDKEKYDLIIAEKLPDTGIGKAINDRLKKAASQTL